ncbi:MAG: CPBP family intramembrane glutamic endopeptidase [Paracoccaceae bacterium]
MAFVTRGLHQRALGSLLGAQVLRDFRKVLIPLAALWLALLLALLNPDVGRSAPLPTVLTWLPLVLPLLVLQIGAEELVFRGYLLQQLGARFHHPLIWMGLPSVLFGAALQPRRFRGECDLAGAGRGCSAALPPT